MAVRELPDGLIAGNDGGRAGARGEVAPGLQPGTR